MIMLTARCDTCAWLKAAAQAQGIVYQFETRMIIPSNHPRCMFLFILDDRNWPQQQSLETIVSRLWERQGSVQNATQTLLFR